MDEQSKLTKDDLKNVSGGAEEETKEIRDFIRKHDPGYRVEDEMDVLRWLYQKTGINFDTIQLSWQNNKYVLAGGKKITHEELMGMLSERYPD